MALKIRLRQQGRTNRPFYRIVVADARTRRDGKYVESLGWYNPFEADESKNFVLDADRVQYWLNTGAELSEAVVPMVRKSAPGILRHETNKVLAKRAKTAAKRKARNKKAA